MTQSLTHAPRKPYNLRIIAIVAIAGLLGMALLFTIVVKQFRLVQLRDARDIGSAYIQGFLTPYAAEGVANGSLGTASRDDLIQVIRHLPREHGFQSLQIWIAPDRPLFVSDTTKDVSSHDPAELVQAFSGQIMVELEMPDPADPPGTAPMIEIYAPLYHPKTRALIAVGEVYQSADTLLSERRQFERMMLSAFAIAATGFLFLMYLIARQQNALIESLAHEARMSHQNRLLGEAAAAASRVSSQSNEALLNQLGAELHDGPIQMLSLLALMAPPADTAAMHTPQTIARDVLADLRRIAVGLILPELGTLTAEQTVRLAVQRHQNATGTQVALHLGVLPDLIDDQRKTCIYRVVQEGLNNAFRHGGGQLQSVDASMADNDLHISVRNSHQKATAITYAPRFSGLGVPGLRNRLKVFGGTLNVHADTDGFFTMAAVLPLE